MGWEGSEGDGGERGGTGRTGGRMREGRRGGAGERERYWSDSGVKELIPKELRVGPRKMVDWWMGGGGAAGGPGSGAKDVGEGGGDGYRSSVQPGGEERRHRTGEEPWVSAHGA